MENHNTSSLTQATTPLTISSTLLPPDYTPESWLEMALQGHSQNLQMMVGAIPMEITIQNPPYLACMETHLIHRVLANFAHQLWMSTLL